MIDRSNIGLVLPTHEAKLEAGRMRFFARTLGQLPSIYHDGGAARAAGYADIVAAPTFLFSLYMETDDPFHVFRLLDVPLSRLLHGEQKFAYRRPLCAGETVSFHPRIADIYDRRGGALEFIVEDIEVRDMSGSAVARLERIAVVRAEKSQ
jgi:hypothetical protein